MKLKNEFIWDNINTKAMVEVKDILKNIPVLAIFDPKKETRLETDGSRLKGLGFDLLQNHEQRWRLVEFGSRFFNDVESR
uniref:Putative LOC101170764 [Oryzias latipes] n=1 Tax=Lepeophtheirus salmonis TaxID=72036 RepID=A0A0K2U1M2_LEPSM